MIRFVVCLFLCAPAMAGLQDDLNRMWRGAWVIVKSETYSNCNGRYTNNEVNSGLISGKGKRAFTAGELGKIAKVDVKRSRVDVLIDIHEPVLFAYQDGPFELYREVSCQVELQIKVGRDMIRRKNLDGIDTLFRDLMAHHSRLDDARADRAYNARVREDYPDDYQERLADYEDWQVEQARLALFETLEESRLEAMRLLRRVRENADYGHGFTAGIAAMNAHYFPKECERLANLSFYSAKKRVPSGESKDYEQGYLDGQALAFHLTIVERLSPCALP